MDDVIWIAFTCAHSHTQTHKPSIVTLAAHARQGLIRHACTINTNT